MNNETPAKELERIWREAQSEIYGEDKDRHVDPGGIHAADFATWINTGTTPYPESPDPGSFDIQSALGIFQDWLLSLAYK